MLNTHKSDRILILRYFRNFRCSLGSIVKHFNQERGNFVTIKDISKNTNLLITIPTLFERRHFDKINAHKKVQILISGYFRNLSSSQGSIVEHFKQKLENFLTIKDI